MEPPRVEWSQWRRAKPEVIVEASGRLSIGRLANRPLLAAFPGLGEPHFANRACFEVVDARKQVRPAPRLRAKLHDAAMLLGCRHHRLPFEDVVPVGLFDIDVFAGLAGMNRRQGVPVIGSAEDQGIKRFVFERLAKVFQRDRSLARLLLDLRDPRGTHAFVEIAHIADLDFRQRRKRAQHAAAASAHAHHADRYLIVGRVRLLRCYG